MQNFYGETWGQRKRRERRERMAQRIKVAQIVLFGLMIAVLISQQFFITKISKIQYDHGYVDGYVDAKQNAPETPKEEVIEVRYKGVLVNAQLLKDIDARFGSDAEVFKAILIVESTGSANAVNHNCRYDKNGNLRTDGTGLSNFCKSAYHAEIGTDSVDCGYLQINVKGKKCPADIFTPEKQVALAYDIYERGGCGGLNCWSSYKFHRSKVTSVLNQE